MPEALLAMAEYLLRLAPGMVLFVALVALLPRDKNLLRAVLYILFFVLIRDAMTPLNLWRLGAEQTFWLRFAPDATTLGLLSVGSLFLAAVLWLADPELRALVVWHRGSPVTSVVAGVGVGMLIAAPVLAHGLTVPLESRGGAVAAVLILPILAVTLTGNLVEELLFRGYFQGALEQRDVDETRAALISGLFFGACHAYLASTVTDVGWPVLLFATWEGLVVAFLRNRLGLLACVMAHGLAVGLLATALG